MEEDIVRGKGKSEKVQERCTAISALPHCPLERKQVPVLQFLPCRLQWGEWGRQDREHQIHPELPVGDEPGVHPGQRSPVSVGL